VTTTTGNGPLLCIRRIELYQFRQSRGSGMVHGRTYGGLNCLQIELAGCFAVPGDDAKQLIYFADDFLPDRFRRFFPAAFAPAPPRAATGRFER
jgi:hypothetical protein